ncbi:hypothetical protein ACFW04_002777 [Cataglyphis niger]
MVTTLDKFKCRKICRAVSGKKKQKSFADVVR